MHLHLFSCQSRDKIFQDFISFCIVLAMMLANYRTIGIIGKLSAYSIRDNNRKIPIDFGKCHVKRDVIILLT